MTTSKDVFEYLLDCEHIIPIIENWSGIKIRTQGIYEYGRLMFRFNGIMIMIEKEYSDGEYYIFKYDSNGSVRKEDNLINLIPVIRRFKINKLND